MGIVDRKKEALCYDVVVEMGMKMFVWFDLVGLVDLLAWFRMLKKKVKVVFI